MRWDVCEGAMRVKSPLLELKSLLQSFATEEANEGELVALTSAGGQAQEGALTERDAGHPLCL